MRALGLAPDVVLISRGLHRLSSNPLIGYEPIPRDQFTEPFPERHEWPKEEINLLGYRDREHQQAKPAGVTRIAVLGDSIAAGLYVNKMSDTFGARLETALNAQGQNVEVLNFGEVGYNTLQETETLREKGLAFQPDIVLLLYCLNDSERDDGGLLWALLAEEAQSSSISFTRANRFLVHSALFRFLRYRVYPPTLPQDLKEATARFERLAKDTTEEGFARLAEDSKHANFRVLVGLLPDFSMLDKNLRQNEHERVAALSAKLNFNFIDLTQAMIECGKQYNGPVSVDRYHPSALGNLCIANTLGPVLTEMIQQSRSLP